MPETETAKPIIITDKDLVSRLSEAFAFEADKIGLIVSPKYISVQFYVGDCLKNTRNYEVATVLKQKIVAGVIV
jgi:hypothetical protein